MRMIDAERLKEELLWGNVFLTDNEIDALADLIDNQPTIFPLNDPLTIDELRAMVGNPVYDCFGQIWYIVESYYDHNLIMTDGTHFNDENKYAKVSKRFYFNRPTIPTYGQWIRIEDEKPDTGQYVLVYHKDGVMQCAQYLISGYDDRELWVLDRYYKEQGEITHWMPLPEPPKEVRDDGKSKLD